MDCYYEWLHPTRDVSVVQEITIDKKRHPVSIYWNDYLKKGKVALDVFREILWQKRKVLVVSTAYKYLYFWNLYEYIIIIYSMYIKVLYKFARISLIILCLFWVRNLVVPFFVTQSP